MPWKGPVSNTTETSEQSKRSGGAEAGQQARSEEVVKAIGKEVEDIEKEAEMEVWKGAGKEAGPDEVKEAGKESEKGTV